MDNLENPNLTKLKGFRNFSKIYSSNVNFPHVISSIWCKTGSDVIFTTISSRRFRYGHRYIYNINWIIWYCRMFYKRIANNANVDTSRLKACEILYSCFVSSFIWFRYFQYNNLNPWNGQIYETNEKANIRNLEQKGIACKGNLSAHTPIKLFRLRWSLKRLERSTSSQSRTFTYVNWPWFRSGA